MKTRNKPESYVKSCITSSSSTETLMKMKETRKGIVNQSHNEMIHMKELKTLSKNLGAMVGKQALSDIVIYTKQETAIPCHKIILLSRIPTMLKEIIKEDSKHGGTTEMLMWNLDKKLCLLLLKYLYSGIIDFVVVNNLDESERDELKQFCDTYQVQALCKVIKTIEARRTGEASSDDKSEHFDDMSENRNPEDTVKPKLSKWLDDLKSRDPSMWKKNFRLRFNKVDNKLKLDDFKAATNKTLQIDTDSNSDDVKNMDDKSTSTDTKSVQTKSTELNQHERQNADEDVNEKINETISVLSDDGASTVSSEIYCTWKPQKPVEKEKDSPKEPESMATSMAVSPKQDKVVDKPSVYHYDSDIYDQETIASSKTSDTELVVNSDTEVRHSLRSVNSIYDKNTLPYNASQTKTKEQTTTPNKGNYSSQTVASPELFSDSDSDEDNNRNVLNVPSIKANTQQNLHQLMNMMEKDIEPTCPENQTFDEVKKRKRRLSPSPLDNLKRSKHTSVEHKSSSSSSDLPRLKQVNKVNTLYVNKELDSATNLMKKNNLSVPCVAGKDAMKSRPTARNLAIDFDKIEVDTSQPNKTLNLTVENLKLFDEINETSQHQDNSFFEKETLIVRDKNGAKHQGSDKSSLASSLFFESCMNRNKKSVSKLNSKEDICTVKRSDSGQEKTKIHPTKIDSLHLKRKKVPTPDFLKVKFDQGKIVEIKSSSTDDSDCYPTKALSQSYKFSQKLKKHTPTKPRNTLYHSQPQKKSTTHKPSRSLSQPRKNTNLFDTDSSDEFTEITKRKPKQTQDISFGILSPIPRLNERDTSIHKESETRERQGSRPDFQPSPVGDTNKYSPRKSNEIRSMALDDSRDLNQSNRQKSIFSPVIAEKTAGKTNDPYISYGSNKSSHKKSIFSPVIPGARDGKLCRDENDIASLRFNSDSSEHSGSSPSEPEIISNTRNVSKTKKSPEFSSRLSLSPRDSDIALSRRKYNKSDSPPQTNNRNIGDQSRSNENLSCSIPVLSPARDFWEYPDPVHDDIVVTSPTKPPSDPSPKFFSPPRYVWDDPAYQDNCMFPNEDPYMVDPPTSQYEHNLESRRLSNVDEQASPPKTMKYNESHSRADSSSDTNPKHGIGLFEQKLLRLSQPLQNSQFMKKCSEYFKDKELKLGDQSGNQYSAVEKSSVLSKPSKSIVAPQHMHLSPEVIINKPEGLLDDSSSESLWKLRTKHYEHSKNRADGLDKEDTDHSDGYFISSKLSSDKTNRTLSKENATNSIEKDRLKTIKQKYAISSSDSENGKTFKLNKTGNTSKETFGKIKESKSKKHTNISSCDSDNDYLTLDVQTFRGQPDSFGSKDNSADSHTTATDSKKKNNLDRIGLERTKKYADMSSSDSESTWELISKSKPNSTKQPVSSSIHTYSTGTSTNSMSIQKSSPQTMLQRSSNSQLYRSNSSRGISKTIPSSPALQHTASYSQPNISSSNLYRSNTLRNLPESPTSSPRLQPTTSSYGQSTNSQPNTLSSPLYRSNSLKKSSKTSLSSPTVEPRTSYCQPSTSFSRNSLASNEKQSTGSVQKSLNFDQLLNESLNLTESYLNRLEMQQGSRTVKTPTALPKRTSMGFATDNNSTVTPLADYSTMETPLLKVMTVMSNKSISSVVKLGKCLGLIYYCYYFFKFIF